MALNVLVEPNLLDPNLVETFFFGGFSFGCRFGRDKPCHLFEPLGLWGVKFGAQDFGWDTISHLVYHLFRGWGFGVWVSGCDV